MAELREKVLRLVERAEENSRWRQGRCINLIPSETTPSLLVKMCEISDPSGRYAEHRTMKGKEIYFYQGTDFIREVEEEAREEICAYFGCKRAELRPISGQMANEVVFKAVTKFVNKKNPSGTFRRLRLVMNNDLTKGGHLSSQPMGALFNYVDIDPETGKEAVLNFPVREDNPYKIDAERMAELIVERKPELIVFGKSMFLYPEPVREAREAASRLDPPPVIHYDMAHVLGLYGAFQAPLEEGADIVTGSTHKTFFGPQRGLVVANLEKGSPLSGLWTEIKSRAFPGSTSNHHLGTLLALLMATYEMNAFKDAYQKQVQANARAFARALADVGLQVEGDPADGYTHTHQVLVRVSGHGDGQEVARRLEENNIVCNYQALPDDESFLHSSGIRLGVQEMTRFGMKEADFGQVAEFMADVIIRKKDVADAVARFRSRFLRMEYALPPEEAAPLAARLLRAVLPEEEVVRRLAEALDRGSGIS
jgi:glycine/serine hydroxymethyltransferase